LLISHDTLNGGTILGLGHSGQNNSTDNQQSHPERNGAAHGLLLKYGANNGWRPICFASTKALKKRFSRIRLLIAQPIFDSQEYCKTGTLRPQPRTSRSVAWPVFVASFPEKVATAPTVMPPVSHCELLCARLFLCLMVALRGGHVVSRTINSGSTVVSRWSRPGC